MKHARVKLIVASALVAALAGSATASDASPAQNVNSPMVFSGSFQGRLLSGLNNYPANGAGISIGVFGQSTGANGRGVVGFATATRGETYGVIGRNYSVSGGGGVYGHAHNTEGNAAGVVAISQAEGGHGLFAEARHPNGTNFGLFARSWSVNGRGVVGVVTATTGVNYGVVGRSFSTHGVGVWGDAPAKGQGAIGVRGTTASPKGAGVLGVNTSGGNFGVGVQGVSELKSNMLGIGVAGIARPVDESDPIGIAVAGYTYAKKGQGVYGYANSPQAIAVFGDNPSGKAGYFKGQVIVEGDLTVRGTIKSDRARAAPMPGCQQMEFDGIYNATENGASGNIGLPISPAEWIVSEGSERVFLTPQAPSPNLHSKGIVSKTSEYVLNIGGATSGLVYWMVRLEACSSEPVDVDDGEEGTSPYQDRPLAELPVQIEPIMTTTDRPSTEQ